MGQLPSSQSHGDRRTPQSKCGREERHETPTTLSSNGRVMHAVVSLHLHDCKT
jgi:hypothetical protein